MSIRPANRNIFRRNRVVTKVTPVRGNREVQRTMIVFDPVAFG